MEEWCAVLYPMTHDTNAGLSCGDAPGFVISAEDGVVVVPKASLGIVSNRLLPSFLTILPDKSPLSL
jgi:hypothetical protein